MLAFAASVLVRWIGFLALAGLTGGFALDLLGLPASDEPSAGLGTVRRRLRALRLTCTVLLMLAWGGELWLRTAVMSGADPVAALGAVPAVLTRTHFGAVWIARGVGLLLLLALSVAVSRAIVTLGALVALGIAVTVSLTGHAGDWGDLSPTAGIDLVHVVAGTTWTGGLFVLVLIVLPATAPWSERLLADVMRRFSRLAGWCLLAVLLSGGYNTWSQLPGVTALWRTPYGRVLAVKLTLVVGLIALGAISRYGMLPGLAGRRAAGPVGRAFRLCRLALRGPSRSGRAAVASRFSAYVAREAALAVLVFGCTAILVESTPARHAGHAEHSEVERGPVRVSMEELHASGGVPPGWIFTPPPGDAARGRQLFERLGCFACHRVPDDGFPASSGVGPDLTGAGEHHPAGYLLESIINPNAVIVEGPGHTGPDGLSVMPSYADRLTVRELLDLVAYVRTL